MNLYVSTVALALAGALAAPTFSAAQATAATQPSVGESGSATLIALYDSSKNTDTKETILKYLAEVDDDAARRKLLQVAKSDPDTELRQAAIRRLAQHGQTSLLVELYDGEKETEIKESILRRLAERDDDVARKKVLAVAKGDANGDLRERAIRLLASRGHTSLLVELYDAEKDADVKEAILRQLGARDDETARKKLLAVARDESNPDMQEVAIRALARMAASR